MFAKAKNLIMAGLTASIMIMPNIAGAAAAPTDTDMEYRPITPVIQYVPKPGVLGNYMKGDPAAVADYLGLGRSEYQVMPLSTSSVASSEGMWMESTAYSPYEGGPYTATGEYVRRGIAAVDPNTIPLGTKLYVEGYGHAVAADVGGAIKGNRIDLAFDSYQEAMNWGRRDVLVQVI